jgi:hypothetical protein
MTMNKLLLRLQYYSVIVEALGFHEAVGSENERY